MRYFKVTGPLTFEITLDQAVTLLWDSRYVYSRNEQGRFFTARW